MYTTKAPFIINLDKIIFFIHRFLYVHPQSTQEIDYTEKLINEIEQDFKKSFWLIFLFLIVDGILTLTTLYRLKS